MGQVGHSKRYQRVSSDPPLFYQQFKVGQVGPQLFRDLGLLWLRYDLGFCWGLTVPHLSPSDFSPEQRAGWIAASERKAAVEAALDPDAGRANEADATKWFVASTDPKREDAVATTLRRREFRTYVPVMTVSRTRSRRRVTEAVPLLPRYLFVGLRPGQSLYGLRETPGLAGMVKMDGAPVTVAPAIIAGLQEREAAGGYDFSDAVMAAQEADARAAAAKAFHPGLKVRIVAGPYRTFTGTVDAVGPGDRIDVWMTLFGRSFSVPMRLADVELQ